MKELLEGTETMMLIAVIAIIVVFLAIIIDLASGMCKAWYRKEKWKSDYLKRTGFKFVLYHGCLLIATLIDLLIHFSKLYQWFGWDIVYADCDLCFHVFDLFCSSSFAISINHGIYRMISLSIS